MLSSPTREESGTQRSTSRPGNGATEPILPGFYPDPTICRVGEDYYLATSSFEYFPGVPLFHSRDLLNWSQIGHILSRRTQFHRGDGAESTGIYAGTLRHHQGRFWYITTNVSDFASGQVVVSATDPAGPWSEPVFVGDAIGIDPDLCWDTEGNCFLSWKAMDFMSETGILQSRIDLESGALLDEPYPIWQGSGLDAAEGPHLYHVDGTWYLMLAEGGTERGHSVTIARAPHPSGPFEAHPGNPIFSRRSVVSHPVQNVGHADLVQHTDGSWAAVYLGVRNRGSTPGFHVLGRETFLSGIDWVDGWPVFNESAFDIPLSDNSFFDDFRAARLADRWVTPGSEAERVVRPSSDGGLELLHSPESRGLLCTRVRDLQWTADAVVTGSARLQLRVDDSHWYGLAVDDGVVRALARVGGIQHSLGSFPLAGERTVLRVRSVAPRPRPKPLRLAGPDDIVLSVVDDDGVDHELGRLDGRYLSTEVAAGFTGRMLAVGAGISRGRLISFTYAAG
ncbi:family 43 glycosylhydrolase [Leifsonia sp. SIMBA_070]|uniref:glycoside hydrolase family 43 protein n=1 Tax=Leifsonia sp. SIMBA_070 TaxID=3085810 RepID=UPI00397CB99B